MARKLTESEMLKGTTNAIAALRKTRKGPVWLIPVLEKRRDALLEKLGRGKKSGESQVGERFRRLTRLGRGERGASRTVVVALLALALVAGILFAPSRGPRMVRAQNLAVQNVVFNGSVVAGSIVADTIRPSAVGSVRVLSVAVQCDAGGGQLTITHLPVTGGSPLPLWENAAGDVTAQLSSYAWIFPLQGSSGEVIGFSITGCGVGSSHYILDLQYSVD